MRLPAARDLLDGAVSFPVDQATLLGAVGEYQIEAPGGEPETIREILERSADRTYESVDDAYTSLLGCVSEAYIGRKYYDDRSHNIQPDHQSF